jgi:hypothetical protein
MDTAPPAEVLAACPNSPAVIALSPKRVSVLEARNTAPPAEVPAASPHSPSVDLSVGAKKPPQLPAAPYKILNAEQLPVSPLPAEVDAKIGTCVTSCITSVVGHRF